MKEGVAILILFAVIVSSVLIRSCADRERETVKVVSGYRILELEDGHWYMKCNRNLFHYIECPKCNRK